MDDQGKGWYALPSKHSAFALLPQKVATEGPVELQAEITVLSI